MTKPSTNTASAGATETLADAAKRIRKLGRDRTFEVAREMLAIVDRWELYADETDGLTASAWVQREFRLPLAHYRQQADAAKWAGSALCHRVEPAGIVWLCKKEPAKKVKEAITERVFFTFHKNRDLRITLPQLQRLGRDLLPAPAKVASRSGALHLARERIKRLEAQIRGLGAEPIE